MVWVYQGVTTRNAVGERTGREDMWICEQATVARRGLGNAILKFNKIH